MSQFSFVPVALLLAFVHREGPVGQQARAALLLCAAISARNQSVAEFIAHRSNVCPVLATGKIYNFLIGTYCYFIEIYFLLKDCSFQFAIVCLQFMFLLIYPSGEFNLAIMVC